MLRSIRTLALACCAVTTLLCAAQQPPCTAQQCLARLRQMPEPPSYVGIFVVSDATGSMSSARIWHVHEDGQQIERVEALTGAPRLTYRHGQSVAIFFPHKQLVRIQERDAHPQPLPERLQHGDSFALDKYYDAQPEAPERVAGLDADVLLLRPRDAWRFGYRIWSEQKTGLIVKTQTLDERGEVLEQGSFSELQWLAPAPLADVRAAMQNTQGWRVVRSERERADAQAEGWRLRQDVPGFQPLNFYRRPRSDSAARAQWIFSDGLATVSLFIEPTDGKPPRTARGFPGHGATHAFTAYVSDTSGRTWRVTAVGEAPLRTLEALTQSLEHTPNNHQ
ncbi:MAG: MucB/RseB C-terminal domain-containing protein [Ottowia sp.]|nr:MucB/RseB C-terminal domain-containing protein [Ottowia sp.]